MANTGYFIQPQKRVVSNDNGATWQDVVPAETRNNRTLNTTLCPMVPNPGFTVVRFDRNVSGYINNLKKQYFKIQTEQGVDLDFNLTLYTPVLDPKITMCLIEVIDPPTVEYLNVYITATSSDSKWLSIENVNSVRVLEGSTYIEPINRLVSSFKLITNKMNEPMSWQNTNAGAVILSY